MRRDFSVEYKQKLIHMIRENDEEKWCDFTDWIGDRLLDFGDWIGALDLYRHLSGVESYTKLILDKNNTSVAMIEKIFREVYEEDHTFAGRINDSLSSAVSSYRNLLNLMENTISADGSAFTVEQISTLIGMADSLQKYMKQIECDVYFSEDVYNLVYDEDGRKGVREVSDEDKDRVIRAFEDAHQGWEDEMDKILKSGNPNTLTEDDIRNIKFIAYTAEEPYRSIYLNNVKKYKIGTIGDPENKGAFYSPSSDKIYFENNRDGFLNDPRGEYTTFFHESGHATDYNTGDPYTEEFRFYSTEMGKEVSLQEAIEHDVYKNIENQIRNYVADEASVNRILDAFRYRDNTSGMSLSAQEMAIYNRVVNYYNRDLRGEVNEAACDVYGGVTNLKIGKNGYGHRPEDGDIDNYHYWYDSNGNATGAQSRELWAEYFSYCMTGDEEALNSLREHFPEASKILDAIAKQMGA